MSAVTLETILEKAQTYLPSLNRERLQKAYHFALRAYGDQVRLSGETLMNHALETTDILLSLKPDEDTLIASLLHDVLDHTDFSAKSIENQFGSGVARLINATTQLNLVRIRPGHNDMESWRRMFLSMAKDVRVVLIRAAERLQNMRSLGFLPRKNQVRIARETMYIYVPILSRLGIHAFKVELEDLAFKFLNPRLFEDLFSQIQDRLKSEQESIERAKAALEKLLSEEGIVGEVSGRVKHLSSIYRKMQKSQANSLHAVFDFFALRIILPDSYGEAQESFEHCYRVLAAIHNRWTPMPGRFKDYIAVPKLNGYRSLHTTLAKMDHEIDFPLEIQIRTESMHLESEYGIASHWFYEDTDRKSTRLAKDELEKLLKQRRLLFQFQDLVSEFPQLREYSESARNLFLEQRGFSSSRIALLKEAFHPSPQARLLKQRLDWIYGLERLYKDLPGVSDGVNLNLFQDRIFVLTPQGDVKDLPAGSTPVDFAYSVHTDLGHRCAQAKVNGSIMPLNHSLQNGDVVEIIPRPQHQPNRYWLSFLKFSQAKDHLKAWFRRKDREQYIKMGKEMLNKELKRLNKPLLGPDFSLLSDYDGKKLSFSDREHIVELVGNGTMTPYSVLKAIFQQEDLQSFFPERLSWQKSVPPSLPAQDTKVHEILITGEAALPIVLASCCKPVFPEPILGYVTRGKSIRIHRSPCRELDKKDPKRVLEATWSESHRLVKV